MENKSLKVTTKSGSHYILFFKDADIRQDNLEKTKESLKLMSMPADFLEDVKVAVRADRKLLLQNADRLLDDGDLYLEFANQTVIKAYFKSRGSIFVPKIDVHYGMFQDSVLIRYRNRVDYRFFPKGFNYIETYHVSDGLKRFVIANVGTEPIIFDNAELRGEGMNYIPVIKENYREGLLSPDCVTGKSIL
jgi:hypothetical protein